ncbi:hypothetical protein CR513_58608, partial [Mucuna pruriens]
MLYLFERGMIECKPSGFSIEQHHNLLNDIGSTSSSTLGCDYSSSSVLKVITGTRIFDEVEVYTSVKKPRSRLLWHIPLAKQSIKQ